MPHKVSPIKILVAEGEPAMRSLLQEYLQRLGYEVFTAENGVEALNIARTQKPDLIILELMLPEVDGLEICRLLKSEDATRDILIIFVSGHDNVDSKVDALNLGANDFVSKPFSPRELEARITAVLRYKHRSRPSFVTNTAPRPPPSLRSSNRHRLPTPLTPATHTA